DIIRPRLGRRDPDAATRQRPDHGERHDGLALPAGGRGEGSGGVGAGGAGGGATGGSGSAGPRVQIVIQGHIVGQSGIEELTEMINEAVQGRDVRLVATQVKQGGQLVR
ncbi:hypothetical protein LCGC14_1744290, partial [marine sediment metagenome]